MKKVFCDKCGAEIDMRKADERTNGRLRSGEYGAMLFKGSKTWFPDDPEGTVYDLRQDLCPACQFKLDKLVQDFMNESSGES